MTKVVQVELSDSKVDEVNMNGEIVYFPDENGWVISWRHPFKGQKVGWMSALTPRYIVESTATAFAGSVGAKYTGKIQA